MKLKKRGDLIVDRYGNYYYAIETSDDHVKLVNAFMDLCFRRTLDDIYFEEYQGQRIGERPMFLLKGNLDMIINEKSKLKLYSLEEVEAQYDVFIEPLTEFESE